MPNVVRADTVGSLLRPDYLLRARAQFEAGELAPAAYKRTEDRAVDQAIAMQEGAGLDVISDGELRRHTFIDQLVEAVVGLTPDPATDHIPVPFHDESGGEQSVFKIPLSVTEKLTRRRMMTTEEYAYARAVARRPLKVTLPSPLMLFLVWSPERTRDAYSDPFELFADGLALMREEAEELARMGCTYIQVDAPDFGQLVDASQQEVWAKAGIPFERVLTEGVDMLNELATVPGVTFAVHLCKGNYDSQWISAGGYESLAERHVPASHQLRAVPAGVREPAVGFVRAAQGAARRQDHRPGPGLVEVRRARDRRGAAGAHRRGRQLLSARSTRALHPVRVLVGRSRQRDLRGRPGAQAPARRRGRAPGLGMTPPSPDNNANQVNANLGFYSIDGHRPHTVMFPTDDNATPPVDQLLGVNDRDVAVGFYTDGEGNNHGFTYSIGRHRHRFQEVTVSGATSVTAAGINNRGDIAGFDTDAQGNVASFLLGRWGQETTLAFPGATSTQALGVNDSDEVVGVYTNADMSMHGFTWTAEHGFMTVDDPNGVGTTTINGVNDQGQLVGFYTDAAGNTDGLLAMPQSHHRH